jgi:hypothetical protein
MINLIFYRFYGMELILRIFPLGTWTRAVTPGLQAGSFLFPARTGYRFFLSRRTAMTGETAVATLILR